MTEKVKTIKETISPTFNARVTITNAEEKLTFDFCGDNETSELFMTVLKRLSQRMKNSDSYKEPSYEMDSIKEKEINLSLSKEETQELLYAILSL